MSSKDYSGFAFPVIGALNEFNEKEKFGVYNTGLTKREYFVAAAMQGLCAEYLGPQTDWDYDDIASFAVGIADATLAAMEEE